MIRDGRQSKTVTRSPARVAAAALALGRVVPRFVPGFVVPGVVALALVAAAPARAEDEQELTAREAFAAGRYQEALDGYARLFARTLHPTYLRNVGRCHQMLGDPDKAIKSFREYLRRSPDLPAGQRAEVEGFIAEMEALKKSQGASQGQGKSRRADAGEHDDADAPVRQKPASGGTRPEATIERTAPEPPRTEVSLSHGGQVGAFVRGDTALLPERGLVVVPGLTFGIGDSLELAGGGLIGHFQGGFVGVRMLFADGAVKPLLSFDVPVFFADGKVTPGIQPGAGVQWDPNRHVGLFLAVTASIFPRADETLRRFWLVPSLGVQVRL